MIHGLRGGCPNHSMFINLKEGTQLMAIYQNNYQPYFYIIQDVRNNMYYAGSKYGQDANPSNFMIEGGYETSSETIKELIREHGFNNFIIRKIRTFETGQKAYRYEKRFLEKVDARRNKRFYNKHNNEFHAYGSYEYNEFMIEKYGTTTPIHCQEIFEKTMSTFEEKFGGRSPWCSPIIQDKSFETKRQRYGDGNYNNRESAKHTSRIRYGHEHHLQNKEIRDKQKLTLYKNHGVTNAFQIPSVIENIKKTQTKLRNTRSKRPSVDKLRLYSKKFGIKFGKGWWMKKDIEINTLLEECIKKFGELHESF